MTNSTNINNIIIRKETKEDYHSTEFMTRRAFWNLHGPGCNEHLLVHILRESRVYVPELSRVAELDGRIAGTIMYFKAKVADGDKVHEVLSFGPLCVEPTVSSMHIGKKLLEETLTPAKEAGYSGVVIFGEPDYYPRYGFTTGDHFKITDAEDRNYPALMAYKLNDSFDAVHGRFIEPEELAACDDKEKLELLDREFPPYKKLRLSCQWIHEEKLGRICEVNRECYTIRYWEKEIPAKLKGSFFKSGTENIRPIVGDYVTFLYNPAGDSVIQTVCERKSVIKRFDYWNASGDQYMVANCDYVFIVTSLNHDFSFNRIARYVSTVLQTDAIPVVILTKADLCDAPDGFADRVRELSDKVRVHAVSAIHGTGMDALKEYLTPGATIALVGSSGAGKSTLVNILAGKDIMRTSGIRESDSKGRHTTTSRKLFVLDHQVTVIDTPGMRELGMDQAQDGIDNTFDDIAELSTRCRFSDCRHESEPGCAIRKAIEEGSLTQERYELYKSLHKENKNNYELKKQISKWNKQNKKRR